jgi:NAD+ kinase
MGTLLSFDSSSREITSRSQQRCSLQFRAAMAAAGGKPMDVSSTDLQYLIREHMIENAPNKEEVQCLNNGILEQGDQLHLRWNSQFGTIFVDGSHLTHKLELGDEVFINANAPPLALFTSD